MVEEQRAVFHLYFRFLIFLCPLLPSFGSSGVGRRRCRCRSHHFRRSLQQKRRSVEGRNFFRAETFAITLIGKSPGDIGVAFAFRGVISWVVPMPPRRSCTDCSPARLCDVQATSHADATSTTPHGAYMHLHFPSPFYSSPRSPPFHLSNASPHGGVALAPSFSYAHRFRATWRTDKNPTDARVLVQPLLSF